MSETYEMQGAIKLIEETQTFASGFFKREFVITTDGKYPQDVKFEAMKEKADQLNTLTVGAVVKVAFNVSGNEYKGRYYVNLQAWKIDLIKAAEIGGGASGAPSQSSDSPPTPASGDIEEDVPF